MDSQTPKCGSLLRRKAVRTGKYWWYVHLQFRSIINELNCSR
jgi:hypothetical protein